MGPGQQDPSTRQIPTREQTVHLVQGARRLEANREKRGAKLQLGHGQAERRRRAVIQRAAAQMRQRGEEEAEGDRGRPGRQRRQETLVHVQRGAHGPDVVPLESLQRPEAAGLR